MKVFIIAFSLTIIFKILQSIENHYHKKRIERESLERMKQTELAKRELARQKENIRHEKELQRIRLQEKKELAKLEKESKLIELSKYKTDGLQAIRIQTQDYAELVEKALENTQKTDKQLRYNKELLQLAKQLQKIDYEITKLNQ